MSARQHTDEYQCHYDLYENHGHKKQRSTGEVRLWAGNAWRKEREIRKVSKTDEGEEADAAL
jgi:hypothetical protein